MNGKNFDLVEQATTFLEILKWVFHVRVLQQPLDRVINPALNMSFSNHMPLLRHYSSYDKIHR